MELGSLSSGAFHYFFFFPFRPQPTSGLSGLSFSANINLKTSPICLSTFTSNSYSSLAEERSGVISPGRRVGGPRRPNIVLNEEE